MFHCLFTCCNVIMLMENVMQMQFKSLTAIELHIKFDCCSFIDFFVSFSIFEPFSIFPTLSKENCESKIISPNKEKLFYLSKQKKAQLVLQTFAVCRKVSVSLSNVEVRAEEGTKLVNELMPRKSKPKSADETKNYQDLSHSAFWLKQSARGKLSHEKVNLILRRRKEICGLGRVLVRERLFHPSTQLKVTINSAFNKRLIRR